MLLNLLSALIAENCVFPERRLQGNASESAVSVDYTSVFAAANLNVVASKLLKLPFQDRKQ